MIADWYNLYILIEYIIALIIIDMKNHFKWVVYSSFIVMFFTAINNANLGIMSQLASQNGNIWAGPVSIALIFLGSGVGALYNKYIYKYQFRFIIFVGAIGWIFFNAFSVILLFVGFTNFVISIILIGSLISGFIISLFYNGVLILSTNAVLRMAKHLNILPLTCV